MTAHHRLQCECGRFQGRVDLIAVVNRGTCYCKDCQAFAYFLGRAERILDERGGSDIVQTSPQAVQFTRGAENLACVRLTPKGLMRWYARCCNTPIGNTLSNYRMSFVGLLHACLVDPGALARRVVRSVAHAREHPIRGGGSEARHAGVVRCHGASWRHDAEGATHRCLSAHAILFDRRRAGRDSENTVAG